MLYDTPILTKIETEMAERIAALRQADGYFLDWGTVNEPDVAKQSFPSAEIMLDYEACIDDTDTAWSDGYNQEAHYIIRVRGALANEENTPYYEINKVLNMAVEDLKRLFGINYTVSDSCETIYYQGAQRVSDRSNDIFRPAYVETQWLVKYTQTRKDPSRYI